MTLRARLIAILAVLVTLGFIISGTATYGALKNFLYQRVDTQLETTQPIAIRALIEKAQGHEPPLDRTDGPAGLPIAAYAEALDADGNVIQQVAFGFRGADAKYVPRLPDSLNAIAGAKPFTAPAVQDRSYLFRVLATPTAAGGILIVAIPLADAQDTLHRLLGIETIVAILLVGTIALLAWAIIRKELRPLDEMAGAATEIAGGDLSRRVDQARPNTEVGRLGSALNRMLEQIEQAFDARKASEERMRRFLGDASHELRTPLTSIRGYAELFRRGAAERPEDLALSMRRIEEEAARMGVLVEELLLLASADRMRPMETVRVDLGRMLEDLVRDARVREPRRPIEFEIAEDLTIDGDEVRLRQAVSNLIDNALVHTQEGTRVKLGLAHEDGTAVITVEDAGEGLNEEVLAHAFERFWRRDPSRSRDTGGAGLGLAIVEAIVRSHGGTVSATNITGGGARFTIRLPLKNRLAVGSDTVENEGELRDSHPKPAPIENPASVRS